MSNPKPITALNGRTLYIEYEGVEYYPMTYFEERTCHQVEDDGLIHCSNCGGAAEKQSWAYWNYCPNCGSRVLEE